MDTKTLTIQVNPALSANAKFTAIRVQNTTQQKWFEWDRGTWTTAQPTGSSGDAFYVAAYAANTGTGAANVTLSLYRDGNLVKSVSAYLQVGAQYAIEVNLGALTQSVNLTLEAKP